MWMACAAHAEMLTLLRREWDRARAGSAQARASGGAAQPENLTSVRRVAREVLAQVNKVVSVYPCLRRRLPHRLLLFWESLSSFISHNSLEIIHELPVSSAGRDRGLCVAAGLSYREPDSAPA